MKGKKKNLKLASENGIKLIAEARQKGRMIEKKVQPLDKNIDAAIRILISEVPLTEKHIKSIDQTMKLNEEDVARKTAGITLAKRINEITNKKQIGEDEYLILENLFKEKAKALEIAKRIGIHDEIEDAINKAAHYLLDNKNNQVGKKKNLRRDSLTISYSESKKKFTVYIDGIKKRELNESELDPKKLRNTLISMAIYEGKFVAKTKHPIKEKSVVNKSFKSFINKIGIGEINWSFINSENKANIKTPSPNQKQSNSTYSAQDYLPHKYNQEDYDTDD